MACLYGMYEALHTRSKRKEKRKGPTLHVMIPSVRNSENRKQEEGRGAHGLTVAFIDSGVELIFFTLQHQPA